MSPWRARLLSAGVLVVLAAAWSCDPLPVYPRCAGDGDCAKDGGSEYCVGGSCVYCRLATDCAEGEMCRAGKCLADPDLVVVDAGDDASDASLEPDADEPPRLPRNKGRRLIDVEDVTLGTEAAGGRTFAVSRAAERR